MIRALRWVSAKGTLPATVVMARKSNASGEASANSSMTASS